MDNHQGYSIFSSTPSQTQELIMEVAFASDKRAGLQELRSRDSKDAETSKLQTPLALRCRH
ncbi:hypothetical protein SNOG_11985 [Parastagonospora nodorum SN15]|uniref:Uncharacterized protein n=1 Tax=Phaeosphaeria nodorum (strain SN15 / ATCC MYA-4574 / FGSC 10173) TaxID=321614 RepID=Q0U8C9_PHANO|nr:hypothetical protein SNOG_11985 [Parastagonospora nodorum SN15]EAT80397.1 hypothetical protein SNOG_11985 [Parastagonospora nodorum SN15]